MTLSTPMRVPDARVALNDAPQSGRSGRGRVQPKTSSMRSRVGREMREGPLLETKLDRQIWALVRARLCNDDKIGILFFFYLREMTSDDFYGARD